MLYSTNKAFCILEMHEFFVFFVVVAFYLMHFTYLPLKEYEQREELLSCNDLVLE